MALAQPRVTERHIKRASATLCSSARSLKRLSGMVADNRKPRGWLGPDLSSEDYWMPVVARLPH